MASLSEASLQSLSGAVGLEGTGRPFKTPLLYYLVIGALVTPIRSFTDVRFHGLGRIPSSGPAIIVCNHISIFDGIFKTQAVRSAGPPTISRRRKTSSTHFYAS